MPLAANQALGAAILAGGRAARFGGAEKPLLVLGGRRIIDWQIEALAPFAREILIVGGRAESFAGLPARAIPDLRPHLGPLAGIEAALAATSCDALIVVAGDMPLLAPGLLALLASESPPSDAVVPRIGGRAEPLCARYSRRALDRIRARLDRGALAANALVGELAPAWLDEPALCAVDPDLLTFCDVDSPADLARLERHLDGR